MVEDGFGPRRVGGTDVHKCCRGIVSDGLSGNTMGVG
jgi:hypothetical protein